MDANVKLTPSELHGELSQHFNANKQTQKVDQQLSFNFTNKNFKNKFEKYVSK